MVPIKYRDAYKEVYVILNYLEETEYKKIPIKIINAIKENMNEDYEYKMNEEIDIYKQPMLLETKATLFNIFRDYLATPMQREKILKMQKEDRIKLEQKKQMLYSLENIFKNNKKNIRDINEKDSTDNDNVNSYKALIALKKKNFIQKIFDKIKILLKK